MSDIRFSFLEGTDDKEFVCKPDANRFGKPPRGPSIGNAREQAAKTLCFIRRSGTAYTKNTSVAKDVQKTPKDIDLRCSENMVRRDKKLNVNIVTSRRCAISCRMIFSQNRLHRLAGPFVSELGQYRPLLA